MANMQNVPNKPSPLESLKTTCSRYEELDEGNSAENLVCAPNDALDVAERLKKEDSEEARNNNEFDTAGMFYKSGNTFSMISVDSILTTERLLDKLDLSKDDELLIQEALQEETRELISKNSQQADCLVRNKSISIPAYGFRSLQNKSFQKVSHPQDDTISSLSPNSVYKLGDTSITEAHRHAASTSRYSYIVGDDMDDFSALEDYHTFSKEDKQEDIPIIDIEKYRISTARIMKDKYELSRSNPTHGTRKSSEEKQLRNNFHEDDTLHMIQGRYYNLSNSNNSLQLNKYTSNTSSNSSGLDSNSNSRSLYRINLKNTPPGNSHSPSNTRTKNIRENLILTTPPRKFDKDHTKHANDNDSWERPNTKFSGHKKKNSLSSLRNLFRSPKASRREVVDASEKVKKQESLPLTKNSTENTLSKYIFPAHPSVKSQKNSKDTPPITFLQKTDVPIMPSHNRSKSDYNNSQRSHHVDSDISKEGTNLDKVFKTGNTSKLPPFKTSNFASDTNIFINRYRLDDNARRNSAKTNIDAKETNPTTFCDENRPTPTSFRLTNLDNERMTSPELPVSNTSNDSVKLNKNVHAIESNNNEITEAIAMRKQGKQEKSAAILYDACKKGNKMAFLLYGLALRHEFGVKQNLKESFKCFQIATGIADIENHVMKIQINPFELEKKNLIPEEVPEPLAPALYECGICYLKGYGVEEVNELKGLKYLEMSASYGHIDSMCLSGTLCSRRSTNRERDILRAATWFRIAASRGANLIGSDWIYKKKYNIY